MKFKSRTAAAVGLLAVSAAMGLAASVTPAVASQASVALTAAAAAPAQAPISEICSAQGSKSLCANRQGGHTAVNTAVIGWSAGDPNNDFAFAYRTGKCGSGVVTVSPPCPFSNTATDQRYKGRVITVIFNLTTGLCVAESPTGSGLTVMNTCPNNEGSGGADGTFFVLSQATSVLAPPPTTYAVNVFYSNLFGAPRWLCVRAKGQQLEEDSASGNAGSCQWNELHN
jgi:hypothetical protein